MQILVKIFMISFKKKLFTVVMFVMIILLVTTSCSKVLANEASTIPNQTIVDEEIKVSDTELWAAFYSDLESAEMEFEGKELFVTGIVYKVSEFMLKPCISLDAQSTIDSYGVVCLFDSDVSVSDTLASGDTVTIKGVCAGQSPGVTVWEADEYKDVFLGYVWITNCAIVD